MVMSLAEFYAAGLRIALWSQGKLDSLQQEMALKNIFFLASFSGALDMFTNSIERQWYSVFYKYYYHPLYCSYYIR
jgi:hypothetical protein